MTTQEGREAEFNAGFNDTQFGLLGCKSGAQTIAYIHSMREAANKVPTEYACGAIRCIGMALRSGVIPERRETKDDKPFIRCGSCGRTQRQVEPDKCWYCGNGF